jgi:hypothetical protein
MHNILPDSSPFCIDDLGYSDTAEMNVTVVRSEMLIAG